MTDEELAIIKGDAAELDDIGRGTPEYAMPQVIGECADHLHDLVAEVELLRATLRDRDDELRIRDQEDAESEDVEQLAITADRRRAKAEAEVARLREERDRAISDAGWMMHPEYHS